MADVVIVYWRDIPAQVIVGKGRKAAKVQLPERFRAGHRSRRDENWCRRY